MKQFKENFKSIDIELIDIEGNSYEIKSKFRTSEDMKRIELLVKDVEKGKITNSDFVYKVMIAVFGQSESFWGKFSTEMLREVQEYVIEQQKKN